MHGGNLRHARECYGLDHFIDLSANINVFGPPSRVWESLNRALPEIVHYPDTESLALRKVMSQRYQLPVENILVGNGAGELLFTVVNALRPRCVAIPIPAFGEYENAARTVGAHVRYIPLGPEGWATYERMAQSEAFERFWRESLQGCDLLFLCSPHNPTGSVIPKTWFERLLGAARDVGCTVLYDESFVDFLPDETRWSARTYLKENVHLLVLYSLTKFYSLPGLRLGALFAQKELLLRIEAYRDPWSVNVLAQVAGIAALEDLNYPDDVRRKLNESQMVFNDEFDRAHFTTFRRWPTVVNFVLIELFESTSEDVVKSLGRQGILVRDCANFAGLSNHFIRVAIKDQASMKRLVEGLHAL